VQAGQTVVQLDRADAKVALDQAEAQLARTVREVRNLFLDVGPIGGHPAGEGGGPRDRDPGPGAP